MFVQSLFPNLTTAKIIKAMNNTTMKMPVYTPALKMAPINSQLVRMSPDRTNTIAIRDLVFIIKLFAPANKSQLPGQCTYACIADLDVLLGNKIPDRE